MSTVWLCARVCASVASVWWGACFTTITQGFLEAIIRLATVVPLPTDGQLEQAELTHAGPFMADIQVRARGEGASGSFLSHSRAEHASLR